jgi:hypothetical protein
MQFVQRIAAVTDHSNSGAKHGPHSFAMLLILPSSGECGVCYGDQVVDHVHGTDICAREPGSKATFVQARMADVEVQTASALRTLSKSMANGVQDHLTAESRMRLRQNLEQGRGGLPVQYPSNSAMLQNRLDLRPEVLQIREAHAIDPGWPTADPATPDQARDVEQQGSVVGQRPPR